MPALLALGLLATPSSAARADEAAANSTASPEATAPLEAAPQESSEPDAAGRERDGDDALTADDSGESPTTEPEEGQAPEPGQQEFTEGVQLAREERWPEAIAAFHASLAAADRPATRYNLARAYAAAEQPLEAARHALAFLALPRSPHRGQARSELEGLLAETLESLAILELAVTPEDAEVRVDGEPLDVTDHAGRAYLLPGTHALQVNAPGYLPFADSRLLPSGQVTTVAVALALEPAAPEQIVTTVPVRWRRPLALSLAAAGGGLWAAGLATWAAAQAQQSDIEGLDPTAAGNYDKADRYTNLRSAAPPLAFGGGALAAAAALLSERAPSRHWSWVPLTAGTALAGLGLVLAIPKPDRVRPWRTDEPTRALGFVLVGAALPALGLGARWLWQGGNVEIALTPDGLRGSF